VGGIESPFRTTCWTNAKGGSRSDVGVDLQKGRKWGMHESVTIKAHEKKGTSRDWAYGRKSQVQAKEGEEKLTQRQHLSQNCNVPGKKKRTGVVGGERGLWGRRQVGVDCKHGRMNREGKGEGMGGNPKWVPSPGAKAGSVFRKRGNSIDCKVQTTNTWGKIWFPVTKIRSTEDASTNQKRGIGYREAKQQVLRKRTPRKKKKNRQAR